MITYAEAIRALHIWAAAPRYSELRAAANRALIAFLEQFEGAEVSFMIDRLLDEAVRIGAIK